MAIFSKTSEYAIRAVLYIASRMHEGRRPGIIEIAAYINSPVHFLGKILQKLSKSGLIKSIKGPQGGFYMSEEDLQRPIADIIITLDGPGVFTGCVLGLRHCSESTPCPLHHEFKQIRNNMTKMLYQTRIGRFNEEVLAETMALSMS